MLNKVLLVLLLAFLMIFVFSCATEVEPEEVVDEPEEVVAEPEPEDEPEEVVAEPEPEDEPEEYVHTFNHIGVTPEEFQRRWNNVISEVGEGYTIGNLDATAKDLYGLGGDWAVFSVDGWLNLEILIHPEGYIGDMYLDAAPLTEAQGIDLIAMITALIAGVTGYDADRSFNIAIDDLGLENIDVDFHLELFESDNAAIRIYGDTYGWELSVQPQ
jgi:hypothetical protein